MVILVTGSKGFIGRHLCLALRRLGTHEVLEFDVDQPGERLDELAQRAEVVFHLAGVNRPESEAEFERGNAALTRTLCEKLKAGGRRAAVVLSSSIQAALDNPYGRSKKGAEEAVMAYHRETGAVVRIYRLPNVFGKWSRPNYNTVVATFCHNLQRGLPVQINNRETALRLVYIDDVIRAFVGALGALRMTTAGQGRDGGEAGCYAEVQPVHETTVGGLYDVLAGFREAQAKCLVPNVADPLVKKLYTTYLSFQDPKDLAQPVAMKTDARGWLFELIKSPYAGQIFVSKTKPGITRGNHYHDTKVEKFCVIQGEGIIRFRHALSEPAGEAGKGTAAIIEYRVSDGDIRVVNIPPGYTHSIENTGRGDMITLFWANEIFDPEQPDTYSLAVQ